MLGRKADARRLFNRLKRLGNDVGLFAEEYDPEAKRMLGNFPQAFSHVALINTALNLMQEENKNHARKKKPRKITRRQGAGDRRRRHRS
jgi:GH15 family glucan-1,4-alpha-glucosidase